MSKLSQLLRDSINKPEPVLYVSSEDMLKLRRLGMQVVHAESARERRLAAEARYEFLLCLEPSAVLVESQMYNGKVIRTTVQDQIDLLNSRI